MIAKAWLLGLLPIACWCQQVQLGVKAGVPFLPSFETASEFHIGFGAGATSATRRYRVGPMVRISLPAGFAVEFDALYQRLGYDAVTESASVFIYTRALENSWEFPLLGSYRFLRRLPLHPYVSAGPAFRITNLSSASNTKSWPGQYIPVATPFDPSTVYPRSGHGLATALGAEFHAGFLRISTEFRYTRWAADPQANFFLHSNPNQAELLFGFGINAH